ncbi:MAG: succinate dehydrogenase cytochrome b subunit [Sediminicola sp.]
MKSSLGRKIAMSLSGIFLILFLTLHVSLNLTSVFSADLFNKVSHFFGYDPFIQYLGQPILASGVIFHFVMGFVLEIRNHRARRIKYVYKYNSASWMSRNMIITGGVILCYFCLHWYDFWFHELNYKFVEMKVPDPERYYPELVSKFQNPWRTLFYCLAFVMLGLHLWHGFYSSMQSIGFDNKYARFLGKVGKVFAIVVPSGFITIALVHHFLY